MDRFLNSYCDNEVTEPIELECFPQHLLSSVVSKMTYREAAVFERCSRFSRDGCKNRSIPLKCKVARIHFGKYIRPNDSDISVTVSSEYNRFDTFPFPFVKAKNLRLNTDELRLTEVFDNERLQRVINIVKENGFKARLICFDFSESVPSFEVKLFDELLKVCEAERLSCRHGISDIYLRNDIVHELKSICLEFGPSENSFLNFEATRIQINRTEIDPYALNTYFLQWNYGHRTIDRLKMYCDFDIAAEKATVFTGLITDEFDADHPDLDTFPLVQEACLEPLKSNGMIGLFKVNGGRSGKDYVYVITYNKLVDAFSNDMDCSEAIFSHLRQAGTVCEFCGGFGRNCIRLYSCF